MNPTTEQTAAVDAFLTEENLTVEAGAGTGKTSTLKLMSGATDRRGLYIAYNRSIAQESAQTFPQNVQCRTAHSVAFRWVAQKWTYDKLMGRLKSGRMSQRDLARRLRSDYPLRVADDLMLTPERVAGIAMNTVRSWCYTGDREIKAGHVPDILRIDTPEQRGILAEAVVPMAKAAWEDLSRPDGVLRFAHDHYLKIWALTNPSLPFDFVMVDEAQDSNGVVTSVVQHQSCQIAAVGDRNQAIYGWRGATDAMDAFGSKHHVYLTRSFRFGPAIADEANKWLEVMEAKLRLTGSPEIRSTVVEKEGGARAVLCRTNAEAMTNVIRAHAAGIDVALVGDGKEIAAFARAARELMDHGSTSHHDLFTFTSWNMVREYVDQAYDGGEIAVMVKLIDEFTPEGVIKAVEQCGDERTAQLTVSTAHKAKGREWPSVRIATDFEKSVEDEIPHGESMLAYVACTRAQEVLDREGLKWVDDLLELRQAV